MVRVITTRRLIPAPHSTAVARTRSYSKSNHSVCVSVCVRVCVFTRVEVARGALERTHVCSEELVCETN
jgi:hypothetical protein